MENNSLKFTLAKMSAVLAGGSRKALTSWQDIDFAFIQIDLHKIQVSRFFQFIGTEKRDKSGKLLLVSSMH